MRPHVRGSEIVILTIAASALAACTASSSTDATSPPSSAIASSVTTSTAEPAATSARPQSAPASEGALGRPGCEPPSPVSRGAGFPEVEGTSDRIQLWGLIMADGPDNPLHVNEQVKIVWRITGSGPLHLTSIGPDGRAHRLPWGPDPHLSSTYKRPGAEWGAGYLFTQPGCWTLRATRGTAAADVWLKIGT